MMKVYTPHRDSRICTEHEHNLYAVYLFYFIDKKIENKRDVIALNEPSCNFDYTILNVQSNTKVIKV